MGWLCHPQARLTMEEVKWSAFPFDGIPIPIDRFPKCHYINILEPCRYHVCLVVSYDRSSGKAHRSKLIVNVIFLPKKLDFNMSEIIFMSENIITKQSLKLKKMTTVHFDSIFKRKLKGCNNGHKVVVIEWSPNGPEWSTGGNQGVSDWCWMDAGFRPWTLIFKGGLLLGQW